MTIHSGGILQPRVTSLELYESILVTFFVAFSGLPIKDRGWFLPVLVNSNNKKRTTFPKKRVLWSLSLEE